MVDSAWFSHCLPLVRRLLGIIAAVLTLTGWLGASQHCNLEAAGIFGHEDGTGKACCPNSLEGCTDGCPVVETATYRVAEKSASFVVPQFAVCKCLHCAALIPPFSAEALNETVRHTLGEIRPWVPAWHFDRRTAAVPGAPALRIS